MTEAMKDADLRSSDEVFFNRVELALKLMRGQDVNRLIDSMAIAMPTELGRANADIYAMVTGRFRAGDSTIGSQFRAAGAPGEYTQMTLQDYRVMAGVPSDSLAAMERGVIQKYGKAQCATVGYCINPLMTNYLAALTRPRDWPDLPATFAKSVYLAPAYALSRGDTAALRSAAISLDSMSQARLAGARNEEGSTIGALEAYLALGDSLKALALARRLTDSSFMVTAIEASTPFRMPSALLWPHAILLRADLEAAKGNKTIAKEFYTRFLALWAKADPEFAPLMDRVRRAAK
jgi:hypothetical protein